MSTIGHMPKVTIDDTSLSDEKTVDAILDSLDVPDTEGTAPRDTPLPDEMKRMPPLPDWTRRLYNNYLFQTWDKKSASDVWLAANTKAGILRRVVIAGLKDEDEAKYLRSEFARRRYIAGDAQLTDAFLSGVVNEVAATRDRRKNQRYFLSDLRDVRNYFKWHNGHIVESSGRILPISSSGRTEEDVALLRAIYERLPPTLFDRSSVHMGFMEDRLKIADETCPLCGGASAKKSERSSYKRRGEVVKHLAKFNKEYPERLFNIWLRQRVRPGDFTSSTELHSDYLEWLANHGNSRSESTVAKGAELTPNKFGRMMRATQYTFCKRNSGNGYRATLKAGKQRR